jgi:hypothetical protein
MLIADLPNFNPNLKDAENQGIESSHATDPNESRVSPTSRKQIKSKDKHSI